MNAKEIFEKLVERAHAYSFRLSSSLRRKPVGKPGELIAALSPEDREELKNLSSKDAKEAKRDHLRYMMGTYPESNTTIHTHTIKKDNEDE